MVEKKYQLGFNNYPVSLMSRIFSNKNSVLILAPNKEVLNLFKEHLEILTPKEIFDKTVNIDNENDELILNNINSILKKHPQRIIFPNINDKITYQLLSIAITGTDVITGYFKDENVKDIRDAAVKFSFLSYESFYSSTPGLSSSQQEMYDDFINYFNYAIQLGEIKNEKVFDIVIEEIVECRPTGLNTIFECK